MANGAIAGKMAVNQEHEIEPKVLDNAIEAFEAAAAKFSRDAITDANVRINYTKNIKRISEEVRALVNSKSITVKEGATFCNEMRNKIMMEVRAVTSPQGRAVAQKMKGEGKSLEYLMNKYAGDKYGGKKFSQLTQVQKNAVLYEIIEASGRDNAKFSATTRRLQIIGKVGLLLTGVLATHAIIYADNKPKEAIRQGLGIGGGIFGGFLAGLALSSICGPGAPFCAVAVVLAGSISGGIAGTYVADTLDDEIEEFSRWQIN